MHESNEIQLHELEEIEARLASSDDDEDTREGDGFAVISASGFAVISASGFAVISASGFAVI